MYLIKREELDILKKNVWEKKDGFPKKSPSGST